MAIPTLAMIPSGYKAGKLYSVLPSDGTGDFTVARNSKATRVNQSGLIEEVDVNVPRLDYSAGGCPVLLTEIQSQNLITYSEDFSQWSIDGNQSSPTTISGLNPDGSSQVYQINLNSGGNIQRTISVSSSIDYTFSVYIKGSGIGRLILSNAQAVPENYVDFTATSEWQRIELTGSSSSTIVRAAIGSWSASLASGSIQIFGAQVEQQPAATSYIKSNSGSATTREADLVNGAGSTATFNSLEHTFFVDLNSVFESSVNSDISIVGSTGSTNDNKILIRKQSNNTDITLQVRSGAATVSSVLLQNIDFSVKQKLAVTVKENEVKYYRNGFLFTTDTGTIPLPVSLGQLTLTQGTTSNKLAASTKDIRYYNQVLTAAETLELMSYDSFNEMASALQYTIK